MLKLSKYFFEKYIALRNIDLFQQINNMNLLQGMAKAKASGFKGYTPEEVEEEGKKDLLVLKEMLGEQQVSSAVTLLTQKTIFPS